MGRVGKTNYSDEYESSNAWQTLPVSHLLVVVLYLCAVITLAAGTIYGRQLAERVWGDAKIIVFLGPFLIGLSSALGCLVCAKIIKLLLHIHRNTYDTALNTYVIGMILQDIEKRTSIIQNIATSVKEQKSESVIPESSQSPGLEIDAANVAGSSGELNQD